MVRIRLQTGIAVLALALGGVRMSAADWARFRGPQGSGIAPDARPPVAWSATQNLRWKTSLPGPGSSSPILVGDKLLVTSFSGYGDGSRSGPGELQRHLVCLDRKSGRVLWSHSVKGEPRVDEYQGFMQEHGYASHTPASDG